MVNIAAIKAAVEGAEKLTASQLEFAKDRIIMGTERKTMFLSEDSKKVFTIFMCGRSEFISDVLELALSMETTEYELSSSYAVF